MQKTTQLFEEDFARWGLHVPDADAAARKSGSVHEAGWHVLYDFGQDGRGEFLDYYAALRDATDPAVTDDWHVRLYETGDRVPLPTVLEAYMYSRDPTPEELARARRKFANPQPPVAPSAPAIKQPAQVSAAPAAQAVSVPSAATAVDEPPTESDDIALEVGLDLAFAGVEPVAGGDTLASWLMTPAFGAGMVEPAKAATPADDDAAPPDLVFVSEPPPERVSGRISNPTAAITTDDDTFTISMSDDDPSDDVQDAKDAVANDVTAADADAVAADAGVVHMAVVEVDVEDTTVEDADVVDVDVADADVVDVSVEYVSDDDVVAGEVVHAPTPNGVLRVDDGDGVSLPVAKPRHSPVPNAMLTTDIAAVAGSFDPWWYRPITRRIAMAAAAVIAIALVGSAVSHFRSPPTTHAAPPSATHSPAAHAADAHTSATPAPDAADASGTADSAQPAEDATPDSLPVASTPSSVAAAPANPAADDGICAA